MTSDVNPQELLRRQVHPLQWHPEQPKIDSSAFCPTERDAGRVSCLRERVSPEEAWRRFGADKAKSVGTFGIRVDEAESVECPAGDDSDEPDKPEDHAYVEVTAPGANAIKRKARKLAAFATDRGPLFRP